MAITVNAPSVFPQVLAAALASLSAFMGGAAYGWSSPVGVKLTSNQTETPLGTSISPESDEYAWISSLMIAGVLLSPLLTTHLPDRIGRKWTLLFSSIFFLVADILFIFAYEVWIMYIGRILQGCGAGFIITTLPLYLGEITTDNTRGPLGTFFSLFLTGGILFSYAVGAYTSYYVLQYACLALPIIFTGTFIFMPESPFYLIAKGRKDDAIKSLQFFRRQPADKFEEEIKVMQELHEEAAQRKTSIWAIIKNKGNLKAFLICWGLISFQQLTGLQAVLFNTQIILEKANAGVDSGLGAVITGSFQLVISIFTPLITDNFKRKTILLYSTAIATLGLLSLGTFFYLDATNVDTSSISWLPLVSLIVFMTFTTIGFTPIPFVIIGEIFSEDIKFIASAVLAVNGAIITFILTRFYPAMETIGDYFPFWLFAGLSVLACVFVCTVVFETKGLSLKEIQDKLNGR